MSVVIYLIIYKAVDTFCSSSAIRCSGPLEPASRWFLVRLRQRFRLDFFRRAVIALPDFCYFALTRSSSYCLDVAPVGGAVIHSFPAASLPALHLRAIFPHIVPLDSSA